MDNIIPSRFLLITYLAAAVMLGLIVDHVLHRHQPLGSPPATASVAPDRTAGVRMAGPAAAVVVALIALVPIASYYASGVPLTTQTGGAPGLVPVGGTHICGPDQVVLAFPVPFAICSRAP
jgi:hypothetical protein